MSATPTGPRDGEAAGRFEETRWVLEPGDRFRRPPRGWDDALVILQTGDIDVDSAGERLRFRAGSILTFAALRAPVRAVNAGTVDAVLVGVRRRQPAPVRVPEKIRFLLPIGAVPTPGCVRACAASDQEGTSMSSESSAQETEPVTGPNEDLRALERLIGTWAVAGGAEGTVTYEWMDGRYFIIQRVDLVQLGQLIRGTEIIGHHRDFGAGPDPEIRSCFYDNMGNTLRYVYELEGDVLIRPRSPPPTAPGRPTNRPSPTRVGPRHHIGGAEPGATSD